MGGILHADLKAALIRGDAFAVFEFDDPDGNTFKYAGQWIDSTSLGQYKGFIPKGGFTNSSRVIPLRGDRMQDSTMSVTVLDMDGELNTLVSGEFSRRTRGMVARIRIVAPDIPAEAFYLRFSGQITHIKKTGIREYKFSLGPEAPELETFLRVPIVTVATWPNADTTAIENRAPLVYGIHDSSSLGSRGMLPTLYVDTVNFRYLAAHQHLKDITNVFVDEVVQASGWSVENVVVEGHYYTLIVFDSDQEGSTITFDAEGAADQGDPDNQEVIINPARQLKVILANYVFHAWNGNPSDWHDASDSPIHSQLFYIGQRFLNSRGVSGAIGIDGPITGLALVNKWAEQFYPVFWTSDAKIAIGVDDWYKTDIQLRNEAAVIRRSRGEQVWLRENEHFIGELKYDWTDKLLTDEWSVGFLYSQADGVPLARVHITDTLRGWNIHDEVDLTWAESKI